MPRILGYGEDALTLWALNAKLSTLLKLFGDDSSPEEAVVMYRPSFGRSSGRSGIDNSAVRAEFGEFDAVIGTQKRVHLVEAKWEGSSELEPDGTLRLRPEQVTRHRVFSWYLAAWRNATDADWSTFVNRYDARFRLAFSHLKMAPPATRLARNLEFVLRQLDRSAPQTQDVLLYFHLSDSHNVVRVEPNSFRLVTLRSEVLPQSMYLQIMLANQEMFDAEKG